ncbi:hypothetical protein AYI69_g4129 [Smittium culicis]|uniref:Uncharacterized protein n=1 Tax=Smittium culicis TaxID=133412 RepID=A0A1R1YG89_9FUNG|nr:hypothetical protein AYI69_g4129 [Smittium culicis]
MCQPVCQRSPAPNAFARNNTVPLRQKHSALWQKHSALQPETLSSPGRNIQLSSPNRSCFPGMNTAAVL